MKIKILTANIAFGVPHMDNLFRNVLTHLIFHGWQMITLFINPNVLKGRVGFLSGRRVNYLKRHSNLKNILFVINKEKPDVIMLNEVIIQLHKNDLEHSLISLGYNSFSFGRSVHYDDTTVSSFLASKIAGEQVAINFMQESHAGGGGGITALRLNNELTVIAVHMCVSDKFKWLYDAEIKSISEFILQEQSKGREVVIAGDFNAHSTFLENYPLFSKLNLKNADNDLPTCPTFFRKLKPLDHIFVPKNVDVLNAETVSFGSDHLALLATIEGL